MTEFMEHQVDRLIRPLRKPHWLACNGGVIAWGLLGMCLLSVLGGCHADTPSLRLSIDATGAATCSHPSSWVAGSYAKRAP